MTTHGGLGSRGDGAPAGSEGPDTATGDTESVVICAITVSEAGARQTDLRMMHVPLPSCSASGTRAPVGLALGAAGAHSQEDRVLEVGVRINRAQAAAITEMMARASAAEGAILIAFRRKVEQGPK